VRLPDRSSPGRDELIAFARCAAAGLVAAVVGAVIAYQTGTATPPWLIGAVCLAGGLLLGGAAVVSSAYHPPPGSLLPPSVRTRTDRESGGLQRVERMLERGVDEVDRFNSHLRPWLVQLAEQRLRHHPSGDHLSRERLGDSLWQLTQQPLTTAPTRKQLAEWISRIESL
jgi:hypothetical protein